MPQSRRNRPLPQKQERIAGVEIGPCLVRMVLLESSGRGRYRVTKVHSQSIRPFCALDSAALGEALREGLTTLAGSPKGLSIWASLTGDRVHIHHLSLPQMKSSHLAQGVYWALQREEAFSDYDTVFDFEVEKEIADNGKKELAVTGLLLPTEDRRALADIFAEAGFPLRGITLPLYAMRNFFRSGWLPASDDARIFSHIGAQSSRIGIWAEGRSVLTRGIPIGIEQVANELVGLLRPPPDRAAALRMVLGLGRKDWPEPGHDQDEVFAAVQPALDRMARQIDRTLEYYQTQFPHRAPVACVYLAGSITESPRCTEYIRDQIAVRLEVIDPFSSADDDVVEGIKPADDGKPAGPSERQAYATAFGLALSTEAYTPNFLQTFKDRQREKLHRRINARIFTFFCILAVMLGGYFAYQRSTLVALQAKRNQAESALQAQRPLLEANGILTQLATLGTDFRKIEAALEHRHAAAVLGELSALTPEKIQLETISAAFAPGETADAAEPAPRWVRVTGLVSGDPNLLETDLSLYIRRLESSPLFSETELRDRSLLSLEGATRLQFDIELSLAPVPSATPAAPPTSPTPGGAS